MRTTLFLITILLSGYSATAQLIENTPLIRTTGTAIVYAEPDEVLLNFTIRTEGEDLANARVRNKKIAAETISYLKNQGVSPEHIQTKYLTVGIRYRNRTQNPESIYYEASQYIGICITDLDDYEEIIMGLLGLGINNLSSPTFRTTKHREKMDEARKKAILAAKEKAELLSNELDQTIGKAYSIQEISNQYNGQNQNAYANVAFGDIAGGASAEEGFAPGQLEIKAIVDVSFHLLNSD